MFESEFLNPCCKFIRKGYRKKYDIMEEIL